MTVRWKPDHDDAQSVDDFTADDVKLVRFERMDRGAYWFCVYLVDGSEQKRALLLEVSDDPPEKYRESFFSSSPATSAVDVQLSPVVEELLLEME